MDPIDRLVAVREKPERRAIGLMSGMSIDGLDVALVRIAGHGPGRTVTLEAFATIAYEKDLAARIRGTVHGTTRQVSTLGIELARRWARDVLGFLETMGARPDEIDFLASHGQTVDHIVDGERTATLQIGDGDVLAYATGILTVSDFRTRDIAAGGEGAPLVPLADWVMHARPGAVSACQNLGSIANVTVVPERREDVMAFDTGPANALIDAFARMTPGSHGGIDRDGELSRAGRVLPEVLESLLGASRAFLDRPPPKSAGYDDFGPQLAVRAARAGGERAQGPDLVRTAVAFTAETLASAYGRFVMPRFPGLDTVHVTGGGVRNRTLMEDIRRRLDPLGVSVHVPESPWGDAKEAVAFAVLGDETLHGRPGNIPSATGASESVVLGKISL